MRQFIITFTCTWIGTFGLFQCFSGSPPDYHIDEYLRNRIETAGIPPRISVGEELVYASVMLPLFYQRRIFKPAWSENTNLLPEIDQLLSAIKAADLEGLNPEDYHLAKILQILQMIKQNRENRAAFSPRLLVDLDLLSTDAFLVYGAHLLAGKVNPEKIEADWIAARKEVDLAQILESALARNQIREGLKDLLPRYSGYWYLHDTLTLYRTMAARGDWLLVPDGPRLSRGDAGERVSILYKRLLASGDFDSDENIERNFFDEKLELAVKRFQRRHGLNADGVVGPLTLAAMNVPLKERVRQIELNMERWRWLPQELGTRYLLVNIANFELALIEEAQKAMTMRAVVGKRYRRTPVFSSKMTYLVLSPYWHIPHRLALQDKLPLIHKDERYLEKQNIRVFQGWGSETKEIDPRSIDWSQVTPESFNFRLRQDPGPRNALGRVKFMFPNKFDVYLHDTPDIELFAKTERTFSSGCIRIEKPIDLAEYLLHSDDKWSREAILSVINNGEEQTVRLPEPIDVHLIYCTAWADEDGVIQFRKDIYERDKRLAEALLEKSPHLSELN